MLFVRWELMLTYREYGRITYRCVVTGQHVVADDFTICPRSNMPAIYTEYIRYIEAETNMAKQAAMQVCRTQSQEKRNGLYLDMAPTNRHCFSFT